MGTAADDWQTGLAAWFAMLRQAWGVQPAGEVPDLDTLWQNWCEPALSTPDVARTGALAVREWRRQLRMLDPELADGEPLMRLLQPLLALVGGNDGPGLGPSSTSQRQLASLQRAVTRWQGAAHALAARLAEIVADGLDDYANAEADAPAGNAETRRSRWSACVEARYEQALAEGDLAVVLGEFWAATLSVRSALTEIMNDLAPALGLPTRAELANVQARLARLEAVSDARES